MKTTKINLKMFMKFLEIVTVMPEIVTLEKETVMLKFKFNA